MVQQQKVWLRCHHTQGKLYFIITAFNLCIHRFIDPLLAIQFLLFRCSFFVIIILIFKQDGTKEEGKYKNNVLITSQKKKHLFLIRSAKFRERIEAAVSAAQRASKIALQKADIAISRTSTARAKAELADVAAVHAREDADFAVVIAKQLAPDFQPSK